MATVMITTACCQHHLTQHQQYWHTFILDSGAVAQGVGDEYISTFFVRALYDYQSEDAATLSFKKNTVIEVLGRLESGWWDGLINGERGWFPSNYVEMVTSEEAGLHLDQPTSLVSSEASQTESVSDH